MRQKTTLIFVYFLMLLSIRAYGQASLTFNFTTFPLTGYQYSPKHIFSVWIKDENKRYVNTLMVYGQERLQHLHQWNAISGGHKTDAISGATLLTHTRHNATWNMKNFAKQTVPDGNYFLCFEITSRPNSGPYFEIPFTKGEFFETNPSDETYVKNMYLSYTTSTGVTDFSTNDAFKITPVPVKQNRTIKLYANPNSYELSIYNLSGQVKLSRSIQITTQNTAYQLSLSSAEIEKGVYVVQMKSTNGNYAQKIIVQ